VWACMVPMPGYVLWPREESPKDASGSRYSRRNPQKGADAFKSPRSKRWLSVCLF
jgi:hypothetical protein